MVNTLFGLIKARHSPSRIWKGHVGIYNLKMAKKFFPDDWEKISKEELSNARARLSGFIESTTEKEKTIRDVSKYLVSNLPRFTK